MDWWPGGLIALVVVVFVACIAAEMLIGHQLRSGRFPSDWTQYKSTLPGDRGHAVDFDRKGLMQHVMRFPRWHKRSPDSDKPRSPESGR